MTHWCIAQTMPFPLPHPNSIPPPSHLQLNEQGNEDERGGAHCFCQQVEQRGCACGGRQAGRQGGRGSAAAGTCHGFAGPKCRRAHTQANWLAVGQAPAVGGMGRPEGSESDWHATAHVEVAQELGLCTGLAPAAGEGVAAALKAGVRMKLKTTAVAVNGEAGWQWGGSTRAKTRPARMPTRARLRPTRPRPPFLTVDGRPCRKDAELEVLVRHEGRAVEGLQTRLRGRPRARGMTAPTRVNPKPNARQKPPGARNPKQEPAPSHARPDDRPRSKSSQAGAGGACTRVDASQTDLRPLFLQVDVGLPARRPLAVNLGEGE
jgi:hypothetical protein